MKLSICIPAYGRQAQINELLASIASAVRHSTGSWREVEVIVSDNASSPPLALPSFEHVGGLVIRLVCQPTSISAARNFVAAALAGTGDYCWWMGSDDTVRQDALLQIHQQVSRAAGTAQLWVFDRLDWHPATGQSARRFWYKDLPPAATFDLSRDEEIVKLADKSLGVGGLFSFLGSLVFKRDYFPLLDIPDLIFNTAYPHVYILMRARPCLVCNIPPIVNCRIGDDSFADRSALRRLLVDVDGYAAVFGTLAWPVNVRAHVDKAVCRELVGNYFKTATNALNLFIRSHSTDKARMRQWFALQGDLPASIRWVGWLPDWMLALAGMLRNGLKMIRNKP